MLTLRGRMTLLSRLRRTFSKPPKIWMVTGIQYLEDAVVTSAANQFRSAAGPASIPVLDPTLVAAVADIPSIHGGLAVGGNVSTSNYGHTDERVWAAQFRPLKVNYHIHGHEIDESMRMSPTWIRLRSPNNLGRQGIRMEHSSESNDQVLKNPPKFAEVVGIAGVCTDVGEEKTPHSVLDSMLDVDWALMDEVLQTDE